MEEYFCHATQHESNPYHFSTNRPTSLRKRRPVGKRCQIKRVRVAREGHTPRAEIRQPWVRTVGRTKGRREACKGDVREKGRVPLSLQDSPLSLQDRPCGQTARLLGC